MHTRDWEPGCEERMYITYDSSEKLKEYTGFIFIIILFYIYKVSLFRETQISMFT